MRESVSVVQNTTNCKERVVAYHRRLSMLCGRWLVNSPRTVPPGQILPDCSPRTIPPCRQLAQGQFPPGKFLPRKKPDPDTFPPDSSPRIARAHTAISNCSWNLFALWGFIDFACNSCFWKSSWLQRNTFNVYLIFWVYKHRYTKRAGR